MIVLEKRPAPSRGWALATPVLAVLATMVVGGLLFAALGKDPVLAIRTISGTRSLATSRATRARSS